MPKQVEKTDRIRELIAKGYGDGSVPIGNLAVFEALAINSRPLKKKGSLHEGARMTLDTLRAMAGWFEDGKTVPIQVMHNRGLPIGRAFHAGLTTLEDGSVGVNVLFYLLNQDSPYVSKLDAGVISEVSIGVMHKALKCSACGWDYMNAEDVTWEHVWDRTCANGHTIGKDGTHLICDGLDDWMELSLVDRGGAQGTKILAKPQRVLASNHHKSPFALVATESDTITDPEEKTTMAGDANLTTLITELTDNKSKLALAERDLGDAKTRIEGLEAKLTEATAKVKALETDLADAKVVEVKTLKESLEAAEVFITKLAGSTLAALGKPADKLPEGIPAKIELIETNRAALAAVVPVGGRARAAGSEGDDNKATNRAALAAFRRVKE